MSHPSALPAVTRRGIVLAWFAVTAALMAATSRVRHTEAVTFPIAVGTMHGHQTRPNWSAIAIPGATQVNYGFPQAVWTVRTPLNGEPERRPHPVGFAINWLLYAGVAWAAVRVLLWLSRE